VNRKVDRIVKAVETVKIVKIVEVGETLEIGAGMAVPRKAIS
jgi:hypothetical protein